MAPLESQPQRGLRPPAQGWPLRLPWGSRMKNHSTTKWLRHFLNEPRRAQPPCGWKSTKLFYPG